MRNNCGEDASCGASYRAELSKPLCGATLLHGRTSSPSIRPTMELRYPSVTTLSTSNDNTRAHSRVEQPSHLKKNPAPRPAASRAPATPGLNQSSLEADGIASGLGEQPSHCQSPPPHRLPSRQGLRMKVHRTRDAGGSGDSAPAAATTVRAPSSIAGSSVSSSTEYSRCSPTPPSSLSGRAHAVHPVPSFVPSTRPPTANIAAPYTLKIHSRAACPAESGMSLQCSDTITSGPRVSSMDGGVVTLSTTQLQEVDEQTPMDAPPYGRTVHEEGGSLAATSMDKAQVPPVSSSASLPTSPSKRESCVRLRGSSCIPAFSSPRTTTSLYGAAQNSTALMEAIHARRQRCSHQMAALSARHFCGTGEATAPSQPFAAASAESTPEQRAQQTRRTSIYRDIFSTPEALTGRQVPTLRSSARKLVLSGRGVALSSQNGEAPSQTYQEENRAATRRASTPGEMAGVSLRYRPGAPKGESCMFGASEMAPTSPTLTVRTGLTAFDRRGEDSACASLPPHTGSVLQTPTALGDPSIYIPFSSESPRCSTTVGRASMEEGAHRKLPYSSPLATALPMFGLKENRVVHDGYKWDQNSLEVEEESGVDGLEGLGLEAVLADAMPCGRAFTLNLLSTWGDEHEVGLSAIELFDEDGHRLLPRPCKATLTSGVAVEGGRQTTSLERHVVTLNAESSDGFVRVCAAYPATAAEVAAVEASRVKSDGASAAAGERGATAADVGAGDPRRQLHTLLHAHSLNTHDESKMFVLPFSSGASHWIHFYFAKPVRVAMMRLHNYSGKGRVHTTKGVRVLEAQMEGVVVFRGEVRAHSGELRRDESDTEEEEEQAGASSSISARSLTTYGLVNCENVLWTADAQVLARIMGLPPPIVSFTHTAEPDPPGEQGAAVLPESRRTSSEAVTSVVHPTSKNEEVARQSWCRPATAEVHRGQRQTGRSVLRFSFRSGRDVDRATTATTARCSAPSAASHDAGEAGKPEGHAAQTSGGKRKDNAWIDDGRSDLAVSGGGDGGGEGCVPEAAGRLPHHHHRHQGRRHRSSRTSVMYGERCPRHVRAISMMLLSTWGSTEEVGLSGLRLRDAFGEIIEAIDVQTTAVLYPNGTGSIDTRGDREGPRTMEVNTNEGSEETQPWAAATDNAGSAELALTVRHLLEPPELDGAERMCDDATQPRRPECLLPFQGAMQLIFVFRRAIPCLGFLDVANYSVGDQTCSGVKEARLFFAEAVGAARGIEGDTLPPLSPMTFRHLWWVAHAPGSRHALATACVYEVTPAAGVTLRKAPAQLDIPRFQSYDVSLYGLAPLPASAGGAEEAKEGSNDRGASSWVTELPPSGPSPSFSAAAGVACAPSGSGSSPVGQTWSDSEGRYRIELGPGTGGSSVEADMQFLSLTTASVPSGGGAMCLSRRSPSLSFASSLGASLNIRATIAMRRARMASLQEQPAWLLNYQPYLTPLLPVGYVCKIRLFVCARDVTFCAPCGPETDVKPTHGAVAAPFAGANSTAASSEQQNLSAQVMAAGDSLKAFLREWIAKPFRACSFVNENGDVVEPMRPAKYRAKMREAEVAYRRRGVTAVTPGHGADAEGNEASGADAGNDNEDGDALLEKELSRFVPMVAESCVTTTPSHLDGSSLPSVPLQVVLELLYVADMPFCISLIALHKPLVAPGSAAWVRQLQVLMDDVLIFSSEEAVVRLAKTSTAGHDISAMGLRKSNGDAAGALGRGAACVSSEGAFAPAHSALNTASCTLLGLRAPRAVEDLREKRPRVGGDASTGHSTLWENLPLCTSSLKPFVVFTLDEELLQDLKGATHTNGVAVDG